MHGPICTNNKSSVNKLVDLFHIWPWPLTLPLTLAMNFQGQILKLSYIPNIWPDRKKDKKEWILWMVWYFVDNIWPTFCFHRMLQCRSGVSFLSLATSVRYDHISISEAMCIYRIYYICLTIFETQTGWWRVIPYERGQKLYHMS